MLWLSLCNDGSPGGKVDHWSLRLGSRATGEVWQGRYGGEELAAEPPRVAKTCSRVFPPTFSSFSKFTTSGKSGKKRVRVGGEFWRDLNISSTGAQKVCGSIRRRSGHQPLPPLPTPQPFFFLLHSAVRVGAQLTSQLWGPISGSNR